MLRPIRSGYASTTARVVFRPYALAALAIQIAGLLKEAILSASSGSRTTTTTRVAPGKLSPAPPAHLYRAMMLLSERPMERMTNLSTDMTFDGLARGPDVVASPTNRLMLAILEEALVTFQKGLISCDAAQRCLSCEVDRWIASKDENFVFSFECICSCLKINPEYLREGLTRIKAAARQGQTTRRLHALRRERMVSRRAWRGRIGLRRPSAA